MAAFTSAQSGNWSATTTWVGGVVPSTSARVDRVTIAAGHTVTWDVGTGTIGDDTATAAITINGALTFPRAAASQLTAAGNILINGGGTLDMGTEASPITAACSLLLNDSAAPANNKYRLQKNAGGNLFICGNARARLTKSTSAASAGATTVNVASVAGWQIGDEILIFPTQSYAALADAQASFEARTITGISGNSVSWSGGLTYSHALGADIANATSNVRVLGANTSALQIVTSFPNNESAPNRIQILNAELRFAFASGQGIRAGSDSAFAGDVLALFRSCAIVGLSSSNQPGAMQLNFGAAVEDCLIFNYQTDPNSTAINRGNASSAARCVVGSLAVNRGAELSGINNALPSQGFVSNDVSFYSVTSSTFNVVQALVAGGEYVNCRFYSCQNTSGAVLTLFAPGTRFQQCQFEPFATSRNFAQLSASGTSGDVVVQSSQLPNAALSNFGGSAPNQRIYFYECFRRATPSTIISEVVLNAAIGARATDQLRNSSTSFKFTRGLAGYTDSVSQSIIVAPGQTVLLLCALRKDAAFGSADPVLTVSIPGVGSASTGALSGANAWNTFALSLTNSGALVAAATIRLSFAGSNGGSVWLGGLPWVGFIAAARWYGYQFGTAELESNPARFVDSTLTLSESAAAAVTGVAINHAAQTITVTAARTTAEIYCFAMLDLVNNLDGSGNYRARHITSSDGVSFTTTYTVIVSGGGSITGRYTDANGTQAAISVTGLQANSRVQIFNVTDNTELVNSVITGTSTGVSLVHTADKTIRVRVAKEGWLPIEQAGVFNAGGVTFLIEQEADTVWQANGVNGVDCTEFVADYPNLQIDANDADGITSVARVYAWSRWANAVSADGIRLMHNAVQAINSRNYLIDVAVVDARFQNVNASVPLIIVGGNIRRSDGTSVIAPGPGSIQLDPDIVYAASGSAVAADVWAHPTRTLTGQVEADVRYVNGLLIGGSGTESDPWGPS